MSLASTVVNEPPIQPSPLTFSSLPLFILFQLQSMILPSTLVIVLDYRQTLMLCTNHFYRSVTVLIDPTTRFLIQSLQ